MKFNSYTLAWSAYKTSPGWWGIEISVIWPFLTPYGFYHIPARRERDARSVARKLVALAKIKLEGEEPWNSACK